MHRISTKKCSKAFSGKFSTLIHSKSCTIVDKSEKARASPLFISLLQPLCFSKIFFMVVATFSIL